MTLCGDNEHDLQPVLVHMKNQYGSGETNLRSLGKLLWEMGKSDLAEKYYLRLLNELDPNDPFLSTVYEDLAKMASQKSKYDDMVQWRQKALDIRTRASSTGDAEASRTTNSHGEFMN
jgi:tetratricopeptide (TPR) repeat protein